MTVNDHSENGYEMKIIAGSRNQRTDIRGYAHRPSGEWTRPKIYLNASATTCIIVLQKSQCHHTYHNCLKSKQKLKFGCMTPSSVLCSTLVRREQPSSNLHWHVNPALSAEAQQWPVSLWCCWKRTAKKKCHTLSIIKSKLNVREHLADYKYCEE